MKKIFITCFLVITLTSSAYAVEDTVLAKIGDTVIKMSDFNRMISYYDVEKRNALAANPTYKAIILQRIVQGIILSKMAYEKGFDKKPDIKEQIELLTRDFLAMQYLSKEVADKIEASESDMKLYYKIHENEFRSPEMVRARHILMKAERSAPDDKKKEVQEKIKNILKRINGGEDFAKLAGELSEDPGTKAKGGDLGFFPRGKMAPEFEAIVFSMKQGEVKGIIETEFGYHIVKLEERKESAIEPYENVRDKVKEKVQNELKKARVDEFMEKAMKDAGVELNLEPFLPKQ